MVLAPSHEDNEVLLKHARVPVRLTPHMDSHSIQQTGFTEPIDLQLRAACNASSLAV